MTQQRLLIVGFGFMGEMHAQALAGIAEAEIAGIVDVVPDAARSKAGRLGLSVPVFGDLGVALREAGATIVDICLPTDQHASASIRALEAGKHVFCEKPVALSLTDAERMRAAHRKAGSYFQVGHCIRFWPEYQALERFVRAGTAGRLLSLTLQRRSARPTYSAGGWIEDPNRSLGAAVDLHIHDTDFILHLLGMPSAVRARGTKDQCGWSHIFTDYVYPDIVVQAEGGWNYPATWGFRMAFQAVFERGAVEYDSGVSPTLRVTLGHDPPEPLPYISAGGTNGGSTGNISSLAGYANELRYFIDCVNQGKAPSIATLDQGITSLRVVLKEVSSASTGEVIPLEGDGQ